MEEFSFGVLGCFVSYRNYIISFPFSEEHFSVIMNSSPFLPCGSRSDQFNTVMCCLVHFTDGDRQTSDQCACSLCAHDSTVTAD